MSKEPCIYSPGMCIYDVCMTVWVCMCCGHACAGQSTILGVVFSPPLWAPGTEYRIPDLCGPCHTNILMTLSNIFIQFLK